MSEQLDKFVENNRLYSLEGESGVRNFCKIVRGLGYKDPMHFGQFYGGSYGDLICFLEDNPGALEAMMEWLAAENVDDWEESLAEANEEFEAERK